MHQGLADEGIGDDGLGQQIGGGNAEALQHACRDEGFQVGSQQRQHASQREQAQPQHQDALAAPGIGQRPERQLAEGVGDQVAGHAGLDGLGRGAVVDRHLRQGRHVQVDGQLARRGKGADQEQQELRVIRRMARHRPCGGTDRVHGERMLHGKDRYCEPWCVFLLALALSLEDCLR